MTTFHPLRPATKRALTLLLCLVTLTAHGQTDSTHCSQQREVKRATLLAVGHTQLLDTYLSQEEMEGTEVRFLSHTLKDKPQRPFSRLTNHQLIASTARARGEGSTLLTALYTLHHGLLWRKKLLPQLTMRLGLQAEATIGVMYNTSNSNNPAQARLSLAVAPAALFRWQVLEGKTPLALQYEASSPLLGLAFSPNYGQSYYEIFSKGDYDHNIVLTSPINAPQWQHTLTADWTFKGVTLRVGYLGDVRQWKANGLKYHHYTHAIVLGWVHHFCISSLHRP